MTTPTDHTIDYEAERKRMYEQIGAKLAFAFLAHQTCTSYQTIEKKFRDQPPSEYWIQLAKQVTDDYAAGRFGAR